MLQTLCISLAAAVSALAIVIIRLANAAEKQEKSADSEPFYESYRRRRATFSPFGHSALD